jgi:hypothetical protein
MRLNVNRSIRLSSFLQRFLRLLRLQLPEHLQQGVDDLRRGLDLDTVGSQPGLIPA